jgi:hypothetical protein
MAGWAKWEQWQVTQFKNGCVFKTAKLGAKWFKIGAADSPKMHVQDSEHKFWIPTLTDYYGPNDPNLTGEPMP